MKTSFVIQGPLNEISLEGIYHYQKYGEVIVSCYEEDKFGDIPLSKIGRMNFRVVKGAMPRCKVFNGTNLFRQVFTTLNGVQAAQGDFVIKIRSDERYGDIEPFIKTMLANPDCYTTNNIFFKGTPEPLHPSDHMIGARRELLLYSLSLLRDICFCDPNDAHHLTGAHFGHPWLGSFTPEVALFLAFLCAKGVAREINAENMHNFTVEHARLVNIDEMAPYVWSMSLNGVRQHHTTSDELYKVYPSLKSMDEFWTIASRDARC